MLKDIPVFTTQYGVASLTLNQIPYRQEAYIRIQSSSEPQMLLRECIEFCKIAGAEKIYATGSDALMQYDLHCSVLTMTAKSNCLQGTDAVLVSVSADTIASWREIYNDRMRDVANAAYLSADDAKKWINRSYFVYGSDSLIGICAGADGTIDVVASVVPGAGRDVVLALCAIMKQKKISCEVSSTNTPALNLYHRLGFTQEGERIDWYRV